MRKCHVAGVSLALAGLALCGSANVPAHAAGPTVTFNPSKTRVTFTGQGQDAFGSSLAHPYDLTASAKTNELGGYVVDGALGPETLNKKTIPGRDYFAFTTNSTTGGDYVFTLKSTNPQSVNGLVFTAYYPWQDVMGAGQVQGGANPFTDELQIDPDTTYFVSVSQTATGKTPLSPVSYELTITDAPEPGTWSAFAVMSLGIASLTFRARRNRRGSISAS